MKKKGEYKKVEIYWIDSKSSPNEGEYLDGLEPLKPPLCRSVGFLIEETPEYKTIVHTISTSQILGRITIPNCCIKKVKVLC
jgi:hypothetical protein